MSTQQKSNPQANQASGRQDYSADKKQSPSASNDRPGGMQNELKSGDRREEGDRPRANKQ